MHGSSSATPGRPDESASPSCTTLKLRPTWTWNPALAAAPSLSDSDRWPPGPTRSKSLSKMFKVQVELSAKWNVHIWNRLRECYSSLYTGSCGLEHWRPLVLSVPLATSEDSNLNLPLGARTTDSEWVPFLKLPNPILVTHCIANISKVGSAYSTYWNHDCILCILCILLSYLHILHIASNVTPLVFARRKLHIEHIVWHIEHIFWHIFWHILHIGFVDILLHIMHIVLHIVHIIIHIFWHSILHIESMTYWYSASWYLSSGIMTSGTKSGVLIHTSMYPGQSEAVLSTYWY